MHYAAATDGSLVYIPGDVVAGTRSLVWVDRGGQEERLTLPARDYETLNLSPDGSRAAVIAGEDGGNTDVWVSELARGTLSRLTTPRRAPSLYPQVLPGLEPVHGPHEHQESIGVGNREGRSDEVGRRRGRADGSGTTEAPTPLFTPEVQTARLVMSRRRPRARMAEV